MHENDKQQNSVTNNASNHQQLQAQILPGSTQTSSNLFSPKDIAPGKPEVAQQEHHHHKHKRHMPHVRHHDNCHLI